MQFVIHIVIDVHSHQRCHTLRLIKRLSNICRTEEESRCHAPMQIPLKRINVEQHMPVPHLCPTRHLHFVTHGGTSKVLQNTSHAVELILTGLRIITDLNAKGHRHFHTRHETQSRAHPQIVINGHTGLNTKSRRT